MIAWLRQLVSSWFVDDGDDEDPDFWIPPKKTDPKWEEWLDDDFPL